MTKQAIGERLQEFIEQRGWSKAEFARAVQIQPQHVNGYLAGNLDPQKLFVRLRALGCDLNWLVDGNSKAVETDVLMNIAGGTLRLTNFGIAALGSATLELELEATKQQRKKP